MEQNIGFEDRIVRLIVGLAAVVAGYFIHGWIGWLLLAIGVGVLISSAIRYCGLYSILGWSTCTPPKAKKK